MTPTPTSPASPSAIAPPPVPPSTRPPFITTGPMPAPTPSAVPTAVPPARWAAIIADLAARGVPAALTKEITLAQVVTWNDGSLGCPEPGRSYTQAIVTGMRVVVRAGTESYDYRFGAGDVPLLCTQKR